MLGVTLYLGVGRGLVLLLGAQQLVLILNLITDVLAALALSHALRTAQSLTKHPSLAIPPSQCTTL